jgi:hypothetical protein
MPKEESTERQALQRLLDVLDGLDEDARLRVIRTVATFFEIDLASAARNTDTTSPHNETRLERAPVFSDHEVMTPKQFLLEKRPRTDVDRVACLAYYLSHYRDTLHFKTADITKLNTEAAQRKFSNAAYAVNNATQQSGYLTAGPKGTKQITALGEQYVEALPDAVAAREAVERFRPRRARKKRSTRKTGSASSVKTH